MLNKLTLQEELETYKTYTPKTNTAKSQCK